MRASSGRSKAGATAILFTSACVLTLAGTPARASTVNFDFSGLTPGTSYTSTPVTLTSDGITATISVVDAPNVFTVGAGSTVGLTGNVITTQPSTADSTATEGLNIVFSAFVTGFTANFSAPNDGYLDLAANSGVTNVGATSGAGSQVNPGASVYTGTVSFSSPPTTFNTVVLSTDSTFYPVPSFSLGNFSITTDTVVAAVPEPASWAMMAMGVAGLLGVGVARRRVPA